MLVIRFLRTGKKNQPSFKIVVVEKTRSSTSGRFVEEVGFYNPLTKEKVLKGERIRYWISVGAKPSETVHNLLVSGKIIEGKKIAVHKKSKEKKPAVADSASQAVAKGEEEDLSSSPSVAKATSAKEAATADKKKPKEEKPVAPEKQVEEKPAEPAPVEEKTEEKPEEKKI